MFLRSSVVRLRLHADEPRILQLIVHTQCDLQTVLESCHFFEANVNHQVLRLQISFLFYFALQQDSQVSALQHMSIRSCRSRAHVAELRTAIRSRLQTSRTRKVWSPWRLHSWTALSHEDDSKMVLQQQCLPTVGCGRVCKLPKT